MTLEFPNRKTRFRWVHFIVKCPLQDADGNIIPGKTLESEPSFIHENYDRLTQRN